MQKQSNSPPPSAGEKGFPLLLLLRNLGVVLWIRSFPASREALYPCKEVQWRRKWQPSPVFSPGESHGQRSLVGYSPPSHKESDMTEATEHTRTFKGLRRAGETGFCCSEGGVIIHPSALTPWMKSTHLFVPKQCLLGGLRLFEIKIRKVTYLSWKRFRDDPIQWFFQTLIHRTLTFHKRFCFYHAPWPWVLFFFFCFSFHVEFQFEKKNLSVIFFFF